MKKLIFFVMAGGTKGDSEILLINDEEIISELEFLKEAAGIHSDVPVHEYDSTYSFVNWYTHPEFFWERCFPTLYPYGRGGPSDPRNIVGNKIQDYFAHRLCQGGGLRNSRRWQNNPNFIFLALTVVHKRKCGGIATVAAQSVSRLTVAETMANNDDIAEAARSTIDSLQNSVEQKANVSVEEMQMLLSYLKGLHSNEHRDAAEFELLLKRLRPFSKILQGSPMHMALERRNLHCMISAPAVTEKGTWRWFGTFSPSDMYDMNFFRAVGYSGECEDTPASKSEREKLLRQHPALMARMFCLKQDAVWKTIIQGKDQPLGEITDYWRRVEVNFYI